ncbi:MAG TPA: hypothetical protein VFB23_10785 [Candidatus Acidoferrales bacterium]|nr:hypothetical protein [Terriglobales bacterium]HZP33834.1 hypothetical protein [Candidatus Acidoferrales bacterium]
MPTMTAPMPTTQAAKAPNSQNVVRCQSCGGMRQTARISFHRNVGMLFIRRTYKIEGNLCKSCIRKHFSDFMVKNLLLGWWGTISLIVTPIYAVQNIGSYIAAMKALSGVPE